MNIDIVMTGRELLSEEDHFIEKSSGCTIFLIGEPIEEYCIGGLGLIIQTCLTEHMESSICFHIMKSGIPLIAWSICNNSISLCSSSSSIRTFLNFVL